MLVRTRLTQSSIDVAEEGDMQKFLLAAKTWMHKMVSPVFLEIFEKSGHASTDAQNFVLTADFKLHKNFFLLPGSELLTTTNVRRMYM